MAVTLLIMQQIKDLETVCILGDARATECAPLNDPDCLNKPDAKLKWTPLFRSALSRQLKRVKLLLDKGANPNLENCAMGTPLHEAVRRGFYHISKALLKSHAAPNRQDSVQGSTPLHSAVTNQDLCTIELLLKYSSNITISDVQEKSPLF